MRPGPRQHLIAENAIAPSRKGKLDADEIQKSKELARANLVAQPGRSGPCGDLIRFIGAFVEALLRREKRKDPLVMRELPVARGALPVCAHGDYLSLATRTDQRDERTGRCSGGPSYGKEVFHNAVRRWIRSHGEHSLSDSSSVTSDIDFVVQRLIPRIIQEVSG